MTFCCHHMTRIPTGTYHLGQPLGSTGPWQQAKHDFRGAQDGLLAVGCHPVLAGEGELKGKPQNVGLFPRINLTL